MRITPDVSTAIPRPTLDPAMKVESASDDPLAASFVTNASPPE
jgi:hypothetical protein